MEFFWKPSVCLLLALFVVEMKMARVPSSESAWPQNQQYIMNYHRFIDNGYLICKEIAANRIRRHDLKNLKERATEHKDQDYIDYMRRGCEAGIAEASGTLDELSIKALNWVKESHKKVADKNDKKEYCHLKDIPDIFGPKGHCSLKEYTK